MTAFYVLYGFIIRIFGWKQRMSIHFNIWKIWSVLAAIRHIGLSCIFAIYRLVCNSCHSVNCVNSAQWAQFALMLSISASKHFSKLMLSDSRRTTELNYTEAKSWPNNGAKLAYTDALPNYKNKTVLFFVFVFCYFQYGFFFSDECYFLFFVDFWCFCQGHF